MSYLTAREMRFLKVIYPEGTVGVGLTVGAVLHYKGYIEMATRDRYKLSRKGIIAVAADLAKLAASAGERV